MNTTTQGDTLRFTTKGQVVISLRLRKLFHIEEGTRTVVTISEGGILLKLRLPVRVLVFLLLLVIGRPKVAGNESHSPIVLEGKQIRIEASIKDGRFQERYQACCEGSWINVATAVPGQTLGPVSVITSEGVSSPGEVRGLSLSNGALVEEFATVGHRIIRKLSCVDNSPWVRVVTRFEPTGQIALRQLADRFRFVHQPDWSFSPSVGGFNPDAQYKAPLILVQTGRAAVIWLSS